MSARSLLEQLAELGVAVTLAGGKLRFSPAERVSPDLRLEITRHRRELAALLAGPTGPAPRPDKPAEVASAPPGPATPAAREQPGLDELRRAHRLARLWTTARRRLEQLTLDAAGRKSWPYLQLRQGTYLLPGKACWTAYVTHPCTGPDALVHLLERLSRN